MTSEYNILPADTFTVCSKGVFTDYDQKIVTMLYQPIIGSLATSLYLSLLTYLNKNNENTHYTLMISMKLNLDTILEARRKLEGIGLLKTYFCSKNNIRNFVYELYNPLSATEFVESPLLNTLLYNNVGKKDYEKLVNDFKIKLVDLKEYKEITMPFSKIFKLENFDISNNLEINTSQKIKNEINVKADIDLDSVLELIPDDLLNKKSITKTLINFINNVAYVYNLDNESLKEIIINSTDISHKIDKELFRKNSQNYYEFNNNGKVTNIVYKKQPDNLKSKNLDVSNKSKLIYSLETVSPYDFLASKYPSGIPSKNDLKIVEYLLIDLKMQPGVVNVLIDYILKTNDNKLTKNFVDAVASQWMKSKIENVKDALDLAKKEYNNKQKIRNKVKKEENPNWFNKKVESSIATKEEQEEMSKMIKELVGEK